VSRRDFARTDKHRRWRDAAFAIPVFAALLLFPPFLNLFTIGELLFGIPLEVVYLFTIWTVLVVAGAFLSRYLPHEVDPAEETDKPEKEDI